MTARFELITAGSSRLTAVLFFYQKPNDWFKIGANDISLRKCLQTKMDIYRV